MQEWTAISQDLVRKFIDSMPGRIAEVFKKQVNTWNIDFHEFFVVLN